MEKTKPYSRECEQSVLGAMLFDERALNEGVNTLRETDFYDEAHRRIFKVIEHLTKKNVPADLVTVGDELKTCGELESVGGGVYLAQLLDMVPTVVHFDNYAAMLREYRQRRELLTVGMELIQSVATESPGYLASRHIDQVQQILSNSTQKDTVSIEAAATHAFLTLDERYKCGKDMLGYSSGLSSFDRMLHGLQKKRLHVIAGRASMGKSALGIQLADAAAEDGARVLVFSLEMAHEQIMHRMLARRMRVDLHELQGARQWDKQVASAVDAMKEIAKLRIRFEDKSRTIEDIKAAVYRENMRRGVDIVVIDYLQLVGTRRNCSSRFQEVGYISRAAQELAYEGFCVIALSQLNRDPDNRKPPFPRISDLKESGQIEQDADVIILLYRPEYYLKSAYPEAPDDLEELSEYNEKAEAAKNLCFAIIGKNRNGPTATIRLNFFDSWQLFTERAEP